MGRLLPQPEFYQLENGAWTWCVKGHNGEPFVSAHEPDGFTSKNGAEKNFALTYDYFAGLHAQQVLFSAMALFEDKPAGSGAEVVSG